MVKDGHVGNDGSHGHLTTGVTIPQVTANEASGEGAWSTFLRHALKRLLRAKDARCPFYALIAGMGILF